MNVAIDLDGTLSEWDGDARTCGRWIAGGQQFLREMLARGIGPIIHTCRAHWAYGGGVDEVCRFLEEAGFEYVFIYDDVVGHKPKPGCVGIWMGEGKPIAAAYVDDRAVFFNGSWDDALSDVERRLKS